MCSASAQSSGSRLCSLLQRMTTLIQGTIHLSCAPREQTSNQDDKTTPAPGKRRLVSGQVSEPDKLIEYLGGGFGLVFAAERAAALLRLLRLSIVRRPLLGGAACGIRDGIGAAVQYILKSWRRASASVARAAGTRGLGFTSCSSLFRLQQKPAQSARQVPADQWRLCFGSAWTKAPLGHFQKQT